jgi:V8-like Glu-specific endopeptidase
VARVETGSDEAVATGFLVAGPDLHPDLPPIVLMTAGAHVPGTVHPAAALLAFRGLAEDQGSSVRFRVIQQWWYQPSAARGLDTTILELDGYPEDVDPLPLAKALPPKPLRHRRAYIIGHPGGVAQPHFSLQDNIPLDYDRRVLHYHTPTEPGSAGSPVFNEAWDLIGLHHARGTMPRLNKARGTYAAGEGITIDAIRRSLAEQPPEGPRHY